MKFYLQVSKIYFLVYSGFDYISSNLHSSEVFMWSLYALVLMLHAAYCYARLTFTEGG